MALRVALGLLVTSALAWLAFRELNRPRMSRTVRRELERLHSLPILTDEQVRRWRKR